MFPGTKENPVKFIHGLSNRLRYMLALKDFFGEAWVAWVPSRACPGYLEEAFVLPNWLHLVKENEGKETENEKKDYKSLIKTLGGYYDYEKEEESFASLEFSKEAKDMVDNNIPNIPWDKTLGLHVRMTDRRREISISFFDEANKWNGLIWLATDNQDTQNVFKDKYKDKIIFLPINKNKNFRQTSLTHAAADMYALTLCNSFYGTTKLNGHNDSSFTDAVLSMRFGKKH